jgi:hypothetical protein
MNKFKITALCIALICSVMTSFAQTKSYSFKGIVLEPYHNKPLEGAVVSITWLTTSVKTDK